MWHLDTSRMASFSVIAIDPDVQTFDCATFCVLSYGFLNKYGPRGLLLFTFFKEQLYPVLLKDVC